MDLSALVSWIISNSLRLDNGCLEFQGTYSTGGYGRIAFGGTHFNAHRLVYFDGVGSELKKNVLVRHLCHNRKCVELTHLVTGTHQDNADDMVRVDRQARGEGNGVSKLTESDVRLIRKMTSDGLLSQLDVAGIFDVSMATVHLIHKRRLWKHVA